MRSAGKIREVLNEYINGAMRSAFEGDETFEQAKEEYDYYYYLFQSTWSYREKAYKHFLAKEINEATEGWKQIFLKDLYRFYCPEEFGEKVVREELPDIGEVVPVPEETLTDAAAYFSMNVPVTNFLGELHPVEDVPIRVRAI